MTPEALRAWRKVRARTPTLRAKRSRLPDDERRHAMDRHIERAFPGLARGVLAVCWPFRNEYDARFVAKRMRDGGATTALPVVVKPRTPLVFREWHPGTVLARGVYDIPYPTEASPDVQPDHVLLPMNGCDERRATGSATAADLRPHARRQRRSARW